MPPKRSSPSLSSAASCEPVDAPEGTAARPCPRLEQHLDLDGRVPAGIEDLPADQLLDPAHEKVGLIEALGSWDCCYSCG